MKKITLLFACFVAFSGVMGAQNSQSIADLPNTTNNPVYSQGEPVTTTATVLFEKPMGAQNFDAFVPVERYTTTTTHGPSIISGRRGVMAVTPYTDRATFEAAYPGALVNEDFAGGPGVGVIQACGPVVSSAGDGCFPAGELEDGFTITVSTGGNDVIYIGQTALGNTSTLMGANTFADFTILSFVPAGAHAVGADLFVDAVSNAEVRVYDTGGALLDTFTINNTPNTENFVGLTSDVAIGRIEIQAEADAGELFGNLAFGTDSLGGGGGACQEENPNDGTFENGFNCSSAAAFMTANDVTVAANENFVLTNITASIFANGGITNVDVNYYDDAAGLPGNLIGSQASATIDNQTVIGNNFGFDVNEVEMSVTPFTFAGQAGSPTTYWIELSVTDGGATGSVFWVVTSSTMVGNPSAQFDAVWGIPDPLMDGVYIWEGNCNPLGVSENALAGFSYYPNPVTDVLSLKAASNIEAVSIYNLLGQEVLRTEVGATTSDINLSGITTGAYVMKVTVNGQTGTYKILKN
jgi:hypothetical protein